MKVAIAVRVRGITIRERTDIGTETTMITVGDAHHRRAMTVGEDTKTGIAKTHVPPRVAVSDRRDRTEVHRAKR